PGIYAASISSQLKPLMDALFKFKDDALLAPVQSWDKLSYGLNSGSTGKSSTLTLSSDGKAHLVQSSPTAKFAPIDGQATADELKAVNDAAKKADLATLPTMIPNAAMLIGATSLDLGSTVGGQDHDLKCFVGEYATFADRVKPLVDALQAIQNRLAGQSSEFHIL